MGIEVVFCAAEASPYAKVGGLGDVVGSLPKTLAQLGVSVGLILPRYADVQPEEFGFSKIPGAVSVSFEGQSHPTGLWISRGQQEQDPVPVYLVENSRFFADPPDIYARNHPDRELQRFRFLAESVLTALVWQGIRPDILHLHDWHTAPLAIRLAECRQREPFWADTRSVLTLHNLAYQGPGNGINWLAEGIRSADFLTTVSPTYAREIQTEEYGCGLDDLLRDRSDRLRGIVNGIDTRAFDPAADPFIARPYDAARVFAGKAACKQDLQHALGLPPEPRTPLFGLVSRLVDQKGLDILIPALEVAQADIQGQWILLGTGDPRYEDALRQLAKRFPQVKIHLGFHLPLAQKIYAGSDFFLIPSRFEPCGLGQLIALRYGSIPVVRATGGLCDTVMDIRQDPESGTGVVFKPYDTQTLVQAMRAAESLYHDETLWPVLVRNAMAADVGWETSAKAYAAVYNDIVRQPVREQAF